MVLIAGAVLVACYGTHKQAPIIFFHMATVDFGKPFGLNLAKHRFGNYCYVLSCTRDAPLGEFPVEVTLKGTVS